MRPITNASMVAKKSAKPWKKDDDKPEQPPIPPWVWVFVVACGAIPVVALGGAVPMALGFGGARRSNDVSATSSNGPARDQYRDRTTNAGSALRDRPGVRAGQLAVAVGFEPTDACTSHAFEACSFGRSDTPPPKRLQAALIAEERA